VSPEFGNGAAATNIDLYIKFPATASEVKLNTSGAIGDEFWLHIQVGASSTKQYILKATLVYEENGTTTMHEDTYFAKAGTGSIQLEAKQAGTATSEGSPFYSLVTYRTLD